jgi:hypothetical protein
MANGRRELGAPAYRFEATEQLLGLRVVRWSGTVAWFAYLAVPGHRGSWSTSGRTCHDISAWIDELVIEGA